MIAIYQEIVEITTNHVDSLFVESCKSCLDLNLMHIISKTFFLSQKFRLFSARVFDKNQGPVAQSPDSTMQRTAIFSTSENRLKSCEITDLDPRMNRKNYPAFVQPDRLLQFFLSSLTKLNQNIKSSEFIFCFL